MYGYSRYGYSRYDYEDARAEYAAEMAEEKRRTYKYNCGGFASYYGPCGASDCGSCRNGPPPWEEEEEEEEHDVRTVRIVIARAPRSEAGRARREKNGIKPGDKIRVVSGFSYVEGGPRTGYYRYETLIEKA